MVVGAPFISTWNEFPHRYKIAGLQINLSHDLNIYSRQTYDVLMFLGEVGGLIECLAVMGTIMIGWYSIFNANSYLVTALYQQSTDAFQNLRNFLTNDISNQQGIEQEKHFKADRLFDKYRIATFKRNMIDDFTNRSPIRMPKPSRLVYGCLCRSKMYKRWRKLYSRGQKKVHRDLDMIKVLRQ